MRRRFFWPLVSSEITPYARTLGPQFTQAPPVTLTLLNLRDTFDSMLLHVPSTRAAIDPDFGMHDIKRMPSCQKT